MSQSGRVFAEIFFVSHQRFDEIAFVEFVEVIQITFDSGIEFLGEIHFKIVFEATNRVEGDRVDTPRVIPRVERIGICRGSGVKGRTLSF